MRKDGLYAMQTALVFIVATVLLYSLVKSSDAFSDREALLYGLAAIIITIVVNFAYNPKTKPFGYNETIEETAKLICLTLFFVINKQGSLRTNTLNGGMMGLGFATIETFVIWMQGASLKTMIFRSIFTTPMHIGVGMVMAYYISIKKGLPPLKSIFIPALFHIVFNWSVDTGNVIYIASVTCFIVFVAFDKLSKANKIQMNFAVQSYMAQFNQIR